MDIVAQLEAVKEAIERLDVDLRRANLGGQGGGLCRIGQRKAVFIDLDADPATQLENTVDALAELPGAETIYLPPNVRELVQRARSRKP